MFTSLQTICDHMMRLQVLDVLNNLFIYINILVNIHKPYTYSGILTCMFMSKVEKSLHDFVPIFTLIKHWVLRNICIVYSKNRFVENRIILKTLRLFIPKEKQCATLDPLGPIWTSMNAGA